MSELTLDQNKVAAAVDSRAYGAVWDYTNSERALLLNAQMLRFVADAPINGVSAFPMKESELRSVFSDVLQSDFIRLLKASGLPPTSKTRPMHMGKSEIKDGKTLFNTELVGFSKRAVSDLLGFRARVGAKLSANPGSMSLYELQYNLELLTAAVERAVKTLENDDFWRSNDPHKPLFIPLIEL